MKATEHFERARARLAQPRPSVFPPRGKRGVAAIITAILAVIGAVARIVLDSQ